MSKLAEAEKADHEESPYERTMGVVREQLKFAYKELYRLRRDEGYGAMLKRHFLCRQYKEHQLI